MGNQGMTNWKFTAFLAIALMLVAGMVSTAIASDGAGTVYVAWDVDGTAGTDKTDAQSVTAATDRPTNQAPLPSGSTENEVRFDYTVTVPSGGTAINMQDGAFRIEVPNGFTVNKGIITVTDGTTIIYDSERDGKVDGTVRAGDDAADARGRVKILPVGGSNVSSIEVTLAGADWNVAAGSSQTLTIQFSLVTAAVPSTLPFTNSADPTRRYAEYRFTASSKKKDGTMTRLKATTAIPEPQPYVWVGNAASGTGTAAVTPAAAFEGETGLDFRITYTAPGPMYNSWVQVEIPASLRTPADGDSTAQMEFDAAITISQRGGVNFGDANADTAGTPVYVSAVDSGTIDILVDSMNKGDEVRVFYENITVQTLTAEEKIEVNTDTTEATSRNYVQVGDPIGSVKPRLGSGEITLSPAAVEVNSVRDYTITYKSLTKLENVYLVVQLPNGTTPAFVDDADPPAGVTAFTTDRVDNNGALNYAYIPTADDQTFTTGNAAVVWKIASIGKNGTFRRTIKRLRATNDAGAYPFTVHLVLADPGTTTPSDGVTNGQITAGNTLYVLQATANPDNPDVTFSLIDPADPTFPAASEQTIMFEFVAVSTPIKDGNVSFRIPNGWTAPTKTADKAGTITLQTDADGSANATEEAAAYDIKHASVSGMEITVALETLAEGASVIITYSKGIIQHNSQEEVEIKGYFKSGKSLPERASNIQTVRITNVAASSGEATISPTSVEAGSTDNDMVVRFTAKGSMDGGQVRLELPMASAWGDLQETNASGANYVTVRVSGGTLRDTAVGDDRVIAQLDEFGKGDVLTFSFSDLEAQSDLGIAKFAIWSAGTRGESVARVKGIERPEGFDTDLELVGKVYHDSNNDSDDDGTPDTAETPTDIANNDGLLRVEVGGGGDGSGKATVEIVASKAGPAQYDVTADDGTVSTQIIEQVHAGDDETHLRFVYTPIETIGDGELQFTVSPGWSPPQADSSRMPGFTTATSSGSIGAVTFSGGSLTVPIYSLDKGGTVTINYGTSDGGAVVPTSAGMSAFDIKVKGSASGSPVSLASGNMEQVTVRPQASGRGTAEIDTDGDVYAGDTGRTFTITYTSIGQIMGGKLKVVVPDGDDWADAMAANIEVSGGTPSYGGDVADLADHDDLGSVNDLVISNINIAAGASITVTYMSDAQATAGDVTFAVSFDGGHGPDTGFASVADLSVSVMEARAGSGMVMISQMGEIVAASTGNDITITYTVAGQIKGTVPGLTTEDRLFKIKVPAGWSAPSAMATADANMGTYTVTHSRMADDGTYAARTGEVEEQPPAKAAGATADDPTMYMVARVASEKTVEKGDKIMFTYENATAPAMPEKSAFQFFFDNVQVTPDLNVIVQSAEGASMLALEAADFNLDDGAATVTVKLAAADGSAATRNEDTVVTLTASAGSITTPVTITAGNYHAEASLTATTAGMIAINASTDAEGIADAAEIMVTADTNNTSVDSVSVAPMYAKAGDTVMVSAMGTPVQMATFSVGTLVTDMAMTEDEAGSYSGSFMVVADLHTDGAHTVTVKLNGATGTGMLTIDNMAPTVEASASAEMVANGDMVTITATAADNNSVASVMADVSMLDTTQGMVDVSSGSAEITISEDNEAANGAHAVTVTATDAAGNSASATVMITLQNTISFTSTLPQGISLFSVPLMEEGLNTVSDLETKLGDNVNLLITYDGTTWNSRSGDVAITGDLGILVSMAAETSVTFNGHSWGDSMINLQAGSNLVGLPVNDARVTNISDIAGLFAAGVVTNVIASSGGEFQLVAAAGDPADGPVMGDAAYLVMASAAGSAMVSGDGWENGSAGAAPIALAGYTVDNQTPVLDVNGSVVDEITGIAQEGFRVKVKNLSTKSALSSISSVDVADGYNMTFVDLADNYAARVGDVLEISADSPTPLIGVQPVRHIVTVDDVKNGIISLEDLIAYEIPAETELLRNYPNPFNPETWIPYHLSEDADVKLTIYDVNGELVRDIDVGHQTAAKYDTRSKAIYWDGRNRFGEQVASGIYFYHLDAGDFSGTRKMVILK